MIEGCGLSTRLLSHSQLLKGWGALSGHAEGPPAPTRVSSQLFEKLVHLKHNHHPHPHSAGEQNPPQRIIYYTYMVTIISAIYNVILIRKKIITIKNPAMRTQRHAYSHVEMQSIQVVSNNGSSWRGHAFHTQWTQMLFSVIKIYRCPSSKKLFSLFLCYRKPAHTFKYKASINRSTN